MKEKLVPALERIWNENLESMLEKVPVPRDAAVSILRKTFDFILDDLEKKEQN